MSSSADGKCRRLVERGRSLPGAVRILALALLCAALLSGCTRNADDQIPELLEPAGVDLDYAEVVRTDICTIREYSFSVVPYTEDLCFTLDGTLDGVYTHLGDSVTGGDVLLSLDESDLQEQETALQAELAYRTERYSLMEAISQTDIDIAVLELDGLKEAGASEAAVVQAQADIDMQELVLRQSREEHAADLSALRDSLDAVQAKLGRNTLLAPFDGTIVSMGTLRRGNSVRAYDELITIADDSRLFLSGEYLSETTVRSAQRVWARIGSVEYEVELLPMDFSEYLSIVFAGGTVHSRFAFLEEPAGVSCGDYAALFLMTGLRENVLCIPSNALYTDEAGKYVYLVREDGSRQRATVRTGASNGIMVEITEGLEEGDLVYVKD